MNKFSIHALHILLPVTVLVALLLITTVIWAHITNNDRARRKERFLALWRPIFAAYIKGSCPATPALAQEDLASFCGLWNFWHASLRGDAVTGLRKIGIAVSLEEISFKMLRSSSIQDRLLGIVVLGNLGSEGAWSELMTFAGSSDPTVSLASARALMQINAAEAVIPVLTWFRDRRDWPLASIAAMLQVAGQGVISTPLSEECLRTDRPYDARLIRLLTCSQRLVCENTARRILVSSREPEIIAACLRQLHDKADHDTICTYWEDPAWMVRLQAVKALSRVSSSEDTPLFIRRLKDDCWRVRYLAAQALAAIPSFDLYKWEQIAGKFVEPELRRVLAQVSDGRRGR